VIPVPTIAYGGLSHLALVTDDMDATVRFYRDVTDPNGIALEFSVHVQDFDAEPWFTDTDPVPAVLERSGAGSAVPNLPVGGLA